MAGHIPQNSARAEGPDRVTLYAWLVFALTFGLLISDYMARQVLNAVFPLLKAQWSLSDGQLGLLSGVVAIMVESRVELRSANPYQGAAAVVVAAHFFSATVIGIWCWRR